MRALRRLMLFGVVIVAIHQASATDTLLGKRTEISFTDKLPEPYRTATVSAVLDERSDTLASLELRLAGTRIEIPRKAFADLSKPNLRTISVSYSGRPLSDPKWALWIHIEFGDPIPSKEPGERYQFSSVSIMILNGRAHARMVEKGGSSHIEEF